MDVSKYLSKHQQTQIARFIRFFVLAFVPTLVALNGGWDRKALIALIAPAAEVAWRQLHPATPSA